MQELLGFDCMKYEYDDCRRTIEHEKMMWPTGLIALCMCRGQGTENVYADVNSTVNAVHTFSEQDCYGWLQVKEKL